MRISLPGLYSQRPVCRYQADEPRSLVTRWLYEVAVVRSCKTTLTFINRICFHNITAAPRRRRNGPSAPHPPQISSIKIAGIPVALYLRYRISGTTIGCCSWHATPLSSDTQKLLPRRRTTSFPNGDRRLHGKVAAAQRQQSSCLHPLPTTPAPAHLSVSQVCLTWAEFPEYRRRGRGQKSRFI